MANCGPGRRPCRRYGHPQRLGRALAARSRSAGALVYFALARVFGWGSSWTDMLSRVRRTATPRTG